MLRSRELRHRLELQERSTSVTRDEYGKPVTSWQTRAEVFGSITQLSASEQVIAQQQNSQATHTITTRVHRDVQPTTNWRLKFNDRLFWIASINNVGEINEQWQFICGELKDA